MTTYTPRAEATASERISLTEAAVCDIHARLFGNGQPGELAHIRREARAIRREVDTLKAWRWAERGAGVVILVVLKFGSHLKALL